MEAHGARMEWTTVRLVSLVRKNHWKCDDGIVYGTQRFSFSYSTSTYFSAQSHTDDAIRCLCSMQCARETCTCIVCCVNGLNLKWCLHGFRRHENELCKCLSRALLSIVADRRVHVVSLTALGRNVLCSLSHSIHCVSQCVAVHACLFWKKCNGEQLEWTIFVVYKHCHERVSLVQFDSPDLIGERVNDDDSELCEENQRRCICFYDLPLLTVFDSASTKSIFDILEGRCAHMGFVASSSFVMPLSSCLMSKLLLLFPLLPSFRLRSSSKELPIELDTLRFKPELSMSSV